MARPIKITNFISPISAEDTYPTHKSIFGMGGFKSVSNITQRDAIPTNRLEPGSWCNVTGNSMYEWDGSQWNIVHIGSGDNTNFSTNDLSFTNNRTHSLNGNDFTLSSTGSSSVISLIPFGSTFGLVLNSSILRLGGTAQMSPAIQVNQSNNSVIIDGNVVIQSNDNGHNPTLRLENETGNYFGIQTSPSGVSTDYILPVSDGSNGYVLSTDGNGNLSWDEQSASSNGNSKVVYTSDMSGNSFNERWDAAVQFLDTDREDGGRKIIELDSGDIQITGTLECAVPGKTSTAALFNGVTIRGGRNTTIYWGTGVSSGNLVNKAMIDLPGPHKFTIKDIDLDGRTYDTRFDGVMGVSGTIGIYHHAGLSYNINGGRGVEYSNVSIQRAEVGFWLGTDWGDDLTRISYNRCGISSCNRGFVAEGANLAFVTYKNCQVGMRFVNQYPWSLQYSIPKYFIESSGEAFNEFGSDWQDAMFKDPWGNFVYYTGIDTFQWKNRIEDISGNNGNSSGFDINTARTIGGGPDITIYNCGCNFLASDKTNPEFVIESISSPMVVENFRLEGSNGCILQEKRIPGNSVFIRDRNVCKFVNVKTDTSSTGIEFSAYQFIEDGYYGRGYRKIVEGGHYRNGELFTTLNVQGTDLNGDMHRELIGTITSEDAFLNGPRPRRLLDFDMEESTGIANLVNKGILDTTGVWDGTGYIVEGPEVIGNVLQLDGNSYITIPLTGLSTEDIQRLNATHRQGFTTHMKVKFLSAPSGDNDINFAGLFGRRTSSGDGWHFTLNSLNSTISTTQIRLQNGSTSRNCNNVMLKPNKWYDIALAVTRDNWYLCSINGETTSFARVNDYLDFAATGENFYIGVDNSNNTRRLHAEIARFTMYDRAMDTKELEGLTR